MGTCVLQCLGPTYTGDFHLKGAELRKRGLNRVGNLLVPNSNYCAFEDWVMPILDALKKEQEMQGTKWTPSKVWPPHISWAPSNSFSRRKEKLAQDGVVRLRCGCPCRWWRDWARK